MNTIYLIDAVSTEPICLLKVNSTIYYAFAWQGFSSGGARGVASVRSCKKLPLYLIQPVPAARRWTRCWPRPSQSASVITYLRRGRKKLW